MNLKQYHLYGCMYCVIDFEFGEKKCQNHMIQLFMETLK